MTKAKHFITLLFAFLLFAACRQDAPAEENRKYLTDSDAAMGAPVIDNNPEVNTSLPADNTAEGIRNGTNAGPESSTSINRTDSLNRSRR